jgi:hypothetical protein
VQASCAGREQQSSSQLTKSDRDDQLVEALARLLVSEWHRRQSVPNKPSRQAGASEPLPRPTAVDR